MRAKVKANVATRKRVAIAPRWVECDVAKGIEGTYVALDAREEKVEVHRLLLGRSPAHLSSLAVMAPVKEGA